MLPSASRQWGWQAECPAECRSGELFLHCLCMCRAWPSSSLKACGHLVPGALQWLQLCEQQVHLLYEFWPSLTSADALCWAGDWVTCVCFPNPEKGGPCDVILRRKKLYAPFKIKSVLLKKWITALFSFEPNNLKTFLRLARWLLACVISQAASGLSTAPCCSPRAHSDSYVLAIVPPFQKKAEDFPVCPFQSPRPLHICPWAAFRPTKGVDPAATSGEPELIWTSIIRRRPFVPYEPVRNGLVRRAQNVRSARSCFVLTVRESEQQQQQAQALTEQWFYTC